MRRREEQAWGSSPPQPAPTQPLLKNTLEIKVTKMLLCCRKSCCFKAVGDKAALQGAGFPAL